MNLIGEQALLRVYLQSADRAPHVPTYERVVAAARREGLAGATVLRGILGAGYHGILKPSAWSIVEHVPVIVEIVDSGERITRFVQGQLDQILVGGMLTLERAAVMVHRAGARGKARPPAAAPGACPKCGQQVVYSGPRTGRLSHQREVVSRQSTFDAPQEPPPGAAFCPQCGSALAGAATGPPQSESVRLFAAMRPLSTLLAVQPGTHMKINENGILLRVFIGESDRYERKPLYEAIVQKVRELGLAGVTVLRGTEGFGAHSVVHKSSLLEMSTDLPVVIEVVDSEENVKKLVPHLEGMVQEGMVTMEYVIILMYRHGAPPAP